TAVLSIAAMVALIVLPRFVGSPTFLEPQAALVQNMVDRMSQRIHDPQKLAEVIDRLSHRLRGKLTLYDATFHVVRSTAEPALAGPTEEELEDLRGDK